MTPATHRRPVSISRLAWSRSMSRNVRVDVGARAITAASSSARACRVGRAFVTVAMPLKKREKRQGEVSLLSVADAARTSGLPRRPWAPACQQLCARRLRQVMRGPVRSIIAEANPIIAAVLENAREAGDATQKSTDPPAISGRCGGGAVLSPRSHATL